MSTFFEVSGMIFWAVLAVIGMMRLLQSVFE